MNYSLKYLHLPSNGDIPTEELEKPFACVVIAETDVSADWRYEVSQWLVSSGCLYMMAWGKNCSKWDDDVDMANLEQFEFGNIPDDKDVMTSWHNKENLENVFWFAGHCAVPLTGNDLLPNLLLLDITPQQRRSEILERYNNAQSLADEREGETLMQRSLSLFGKTFRAIRFAQISFFLLFVVGSFFGWHIHTVYRMAVASSPIGEPLFERELLEDYGTQIISHLTQENVRVAIISRAGQKRSKLPDGVSFTHSAFWVAEPEDDGTPHYAVYNLYHGEENRLISSLVKDDPADFLRLTREHDVGVIIPTKDTQNKLINYISSPRYGEVHQINYSLISNPFDARLQNCNEFMLDSLAAMFWETPISVDIKARYQSVLKPTELKASFIRRKVGPVVDERLIMDDHGAEIFTTTRMTLAQFLDSQDALDKEYIMDLKKD